LLDSSRFGRLGQAIDRFELAIQMVVLPKRDESTQDPFTVSVGSGIARGRAVYLDVR